MGRIFLTLLVWIPIVIISQNFFETDEKQNKTPNQIIYVTIPEASNSAVKPMIYVLTKTDEECKIVQTKFDDFGNDILAFN